MIKTWVRGGILPLGAIWLSIWPAKAWSQTGASRAAWIYKPAIAAGYCPKFQAVIQFRGLVRVEQPAPAAGQPHPTHYAISYYFLRSDGTQSALQTRFFTQTGTPQTFSASDTWTLSPGPNGWWPPRTGWEAIEVTAPAGQPPVRSGTASFRLACLPPARPQKPAGAAQPYGRKPAASPQPAGINPRQPWLRAYLPAGFCQNPHFPVSVNFRGAIPAPPHPAIVSYRILRSDGVSGPLQRVRFISNRPEPVSYRWRRLWHAIRGWVQIIQVSPVSFRSAPARFDLGCGLEAGGGRR